MIDVFLVTYKNFVYPLTVMILSLMVCASCYEPEEFVPPVYLEPEVSLVVDNIAWDGFNSPALIVNYQDNMLILEIFNALETSWFVCILSGHESKLFSACSNVSDSISIRSISYRTNDTITVDMNYHVSIDGSSILDGGPTEKWDASDTEFNVLNIEDVFFNDGEKYINGNFSARTEHTKTNQFPRYRFIEGTFKNIRVTKTYNKREQ